MTTADEMAAKRLEQIVTLARLSADPRAYFVRQAHALRVQAEAIERLVADWDVQQQEDGDA